MYHKLSIGFNSSFYIQLDLCYPAKYQLSRYLYYPAVIMQCKLSIFPSFLTEDLGQNKNKVVKFLFYFILYPFYINNNLLQILHNE